MLHLAVLLSFLSSTSLRRILCTFQKPCWHFGRGWPFERALFRGGAHASVDRCDHYKISEYFILLSLDAAICLEGKVSRSDHCPVK